MFTVRRLTVILLAACTVVAAGCSTRSVSEIKPRLAADASTDRSETDPAAEESAADDTSDSSDTSPCYLTTLDVGDGEAPVSCSLPHTAEIVATVRPSTTGSAFPGAEELFRQGTDACVVAFREISGVAIETAIPSLIIVFPDETAWNDGNRTTACVLEYPKALTESLADIDPRRALGMASFYGLETGDCLESLDQSGGGLNLLSCDAPHTIEVYDVLTVDDAVYPGDVDMDSQALAHCFAEYEELFGAVATVDDAPFDYLIPTEQSWNEYDDRSIVCLAVVSPGI